MTSDIKIGDIFDYDTGPGAFRSKSAYEVKGAREERGSSRILYNLWLVNHIDEKDKNITSRSQGWYPVESFTTERFTRRITEVPYDPSQMVDDEDDL